MKEIMICVGGPVTPGTVLGKSRNYRRRGRYPACCWKTVVVTQAAPTGKGDYTAAHTFYGGKGYE